MNILITGGSGFLGNRILHELLNQGHKVFIMTRTSSLKGKNIPSCVGIIEGDLVSEAIRDERLQSIEVVIHLAGENIASRRWTKAQKRKIYDSRVKGTQNLFLSLQDYGKLKLVISASAVGFYGDRGEDSLNEDEKRGEGFLSLVCQDLENQTQIIERKKVFSNCRFVTMRVGMVLADSGGALDRLKGLYQLGLSLVFGNGNQWLSWVHIDDVVNFVNLCLGNQNMSGVFNIVAPNSVRFQDFASEMSLVYKRRLRVRLPSWFVKIVMGEMSQVLLYSQKVIPQQLLSFRFQFKFPHIHEALLQACAGGGRGGMISHRFLSEQNETSLQAFFADQKNFEDQKPRTPPWFTKKWEYSIVMKKVAYGTFVELRLSYDLWGGRLFNFLFQVVQSRKINSFFSVIEEHLSG